MGLPSQCPGTTLHTEHEVVGPEDLAEGSRPDRVHGARLQIHQDGPRHVFVTCGDRAGLRPAVGKGITDSALLSGPFTAEFSRENSSMRQKEEIRGGFCSAKGDNGLASS